MKPDLDTLKTEIERHLEESGVAIFYSHSRTVESMHGVYWDSDQYPDYKLFVKAAQTAGARMITFHHREFAADEAAEALEQLQSIDLPRDEQQDYERRLKAVRKYDGLICAIELSFDHEGRIFLFDLNTDWYTDYSEVLGEIQIMDAESDMDDDTPIGGYFSKN